MVSALKRMIGLGFPVGPGVVDPVLDAVICRVAALGERVVAERARRRACVREAKLIVVPLTRDLRKLVPQFAAPINAHVDFGLLEVFVRACKWVQENIVDSLIFGFKVLGEVPFCGIHRPVNEPACATFSRESNAKSFDDAVRCLSTRAKRAAGDADAMRDFETIWDMAIGECDRHFCVGPKSRAQVEGMFTHTNFGPRCIPSFAIWQKGKCRRIDDALRSGHNDLISMLETIVCCTADLPADVAAVFARELGCDKLDLRLGTDDIASAYRILVSGEPQYCVAALWRPASRGEEGVCYFVLRGFNFGLKCAPLHLTF